jgi:hypothetical protein
LGVACLLFVTLLSSLQLSMTRVPPPPPPAFDLDGVKAAVTAECQNPVVVETELCAAVKIPDMLGEEDHLWVPTRLVPTRLDPRMNDRLRAMCLQLARARFGAYTTVVVVGEKWGNRGCFVNDPRSRWRPITVPSARSGRGR